MLKKLNNRAVTLVISIILLIAIGTAAVFAVDFIWKKLEKVEDEFTPAKVTCSVTEKNGIFTIENTGDISAYIRVAIVVNYFDESGNVFAAQKPTFSVTSTAWTTGADGYYYYSTAVSPAGTATIEVSNVSTITGYQTKVQVLAEAIQSEPYASATAAWEAAYKAAHPSTT